MTKKLDPRILTLRKLVDGTATYSWSDPLLHGIDLLLDRKDFHALGLSGYVRINVEAITAEDAQEERKQDPETFWWERTPLGWLITHQVISQLPKDPRRITTCLYNPDGVLLSTSVWEEK